MKNIIALFILCLIVITHVFANNTSYGIASYYGTYFHGRPTASGEKYDQYKLTAAHKTLPLGTIVKVTNTQNDKSVILKVNDRGPYIKGRIIDVSTKAAELLGFRNKGTTYVKVEVVNEDENNEDELVAEFKNKEVNNTASTYTEQEKLSWKDIPTVDDKQKENLPKDNSDKKEDVSNNSNNDAIHRNYYDMATLLDKTNVGMYGIDLGKFYNLDEIINLIKKLQAEHKQPLFYEEIEVEGQKAMKLTIGKFQNRAYADAFKLKLNNEFSQCEVVKY